MTQFYSFFILLCGTLAWSFGFKRELVVIFGLASLPVLWSVATGETKAAWEVLHEKLTKDKEEFDAAIQTTFPLLKARAEKEDSAQALRLSPPPVLTTGYQMLPKLIPNGPPGPTPMLHEQRYDLTTVGPNFQADGFRAQTLLTQAKTPSSNLVKAVDEYLYLRDRVQLLASHLNYHVQWQRSALQWRDFFAGKNALVKTIREAAHDQAKLKSLLADPAIKQQLAPFTPNPQVKVVRTPSGQATIKVTFTSDIADADFLQRFKTSIEDDINSSAAAKKLLVRVEISLAMVTPASLYGATPPPPKGAAINIQDHLNRFPAGSTVLTAAGDATHAFAGRALIIAGGEISIRTATHEFFHLLGFSDAYLRGYDGKPEDPGGLIFVEFTGLYTDVMGNPSSGEITEEMFGTLLRTYP